MSDSDTIAAIATPPGQGGIAVLRVSGPAALPVLARLFRPIGASACQANGLQPEPRRIYYGTALDETGEPLDDVLAVYMPGPRSFTGEDVCEISCHGGSGVSAALLASALAAGARAAGAGEFTRRAFLNGRMDLSQAEAVAEIIAAPTREGVRLAKAKLDGALGAIVRDVRQKLDALRIQITLCVDFPDEDANLLPGSAFADTLDQCTAAMNELLAAFERARLWREGAQAVLAGSVNAGKSSLLNALLGRERAIVSAQPGTTRDYIEETVNLGGMPLRLVDTAGLRSGGDLVEEEGIRRTRDLAGEADLVLLVLDAAAPRTSDEADFLLRCRDRAEQGRLLLVCNKTDALPGDASERAASALRLGAAFLQNTLGRQDKPVPLFALSAKQGTGLQALSQGLAQALAGLQGGAGQGGAGQGGAGQSLAATSGDVAPNLRQAELLRKAEAELAELRSALCSGLPADMLGTHLETAAAYLADVTGASDTEELYDAIFSTFCIGK